MLIGGASIRRRVLTGAADKLHASHEGELKHGGTQADIYTLDLVTSLAEAPDATSQNIRAGAQELPLTSDLTGVGALGICAPSAGPN